jgi:hypothetical protein
MNEEGGGEDKLPDRKDQAAGFTSCKYRVVTLALTV